MKALKASCIIVLIISTVMSCSSDGTISSVDDVGNMATDDEMVEDNTNASRPNVLLIIADDMGLDASPGYTVGTVKPNMPNLERMMDTGITFTNTWAYPTCTPTRASIITGKYGFRTNVLKVDDPLETSETSLQKYITDHSDTDYESAVIGKWHLSRDTTHPATMGINHYTGFLRGSVEDYFNWSLAENGNTTTSTTYTTTAFTDLAIDWIAEQGDNPWFLWLAYNAPHTPFHLPPSDLHSQGNLPSDQASIETNPMPYYMAALEAMDTEIGRLLNAMPQEERENTVIIFVGDNGTPNQVSQTYQNRRVKGTVYQGGINVPMVVSGASVTKANETEDALVAVVDLFATIADITGTGISQINDSKSIKDLFTTTSTMHRDFAYTEIGKDDGSTDQAIRNATHKYILFSDGSEALYNLSTNPFEDINLLNPNRLPLSEADEIQKNALLDELASIHN